MRLTKISVCNWKRFARPYSLALKPYTVIKGPNGFGKSSLFEAILFALTNKPPQGFNLNTVRTDPTKRAWVELELQIESEVHSLQQGALLREFGEGKSVAQLTMDGKMIAGSNGEIAQWLGQMVQMEVLSALWTADLSTSAVLQPKFFHGNLLERTLEPARLSLAYAKSARRKILMDLKTWEAQLVECDESVDTIQERLDALQGELAALLQQGYGDVPRQVLVAAMAAKDAAEALAHMERPMLGEVDLPRLKRVKQQEGALEARLQVELSKVESWVSRFDRKQLLELARMAGEGVCPICGQPVHSSPVGNLQAELDRAGFDAQLVSRLQDDLQLARSVTDATLQDYERYMQLERAVAACPQWERVLQAHDSRVQEISASIRAYQQKLRDASAMAGVRSSMEAARARLPELESMVQEIGAWISQTATAGMQQLCRMAGSMISGINARYHGLAVDDAGNFQIIVQSPDLTLNAIPVLQLSSGERVMVALCLILCMHRLFLPGMPMLFDETFAHLDVENLQRVQRLLQQQHAQILVITHDDQWPESGEGEVNQLAGAV